MLLLQLKKWIDFIAQIFHFNFAQSNFKAHACIACDTACDTALKYNFKSNSFYDSKSSSLNKIFLKKGEQKSAKKVSGNIWIAPYLVWTIYLRLSKRPNGLSILPNYFQKSLEILPKRLVQIFEVKMPNNLVLLNLRASEIKIKFPVGLILNLKALKIETNNLP